MTDDPIKLFVVVMAILLGVLAFVSYKSYDQAAAFERAIESAPSDAKKLREYSGEVKTFCEQLKNLKVGADFRTLIAQALRYNNIQESGLKGPKPVKIGARGVEKRFTVDISRGGGAQPLTRNQIAKFCRTVEQDSRNILKTLEITMRRSTSKGDGKAGTEERVLNDRYTVTIVFGLRTIS